MGENQIVVYQPNETVRLAVRAEIILSLIDPIRKATSERREYGKGRLLQIAGMKKRV